MNCFLLSSGQSQAKPIQCRNEKRKSVLTDFIVHPKVIKIDESMKENINPCKILTSSQMTRSTSNYFLESNVHETPPKTTPKKSVSCTEDPVTPNTNFKLLTSLAASRDYASFETPKRKKSNLQNDADETFDEQMSDDSIILADVMFGKANRKEKSLALICEKFFTFYPLYPASESEIFISLDEASHKLGVERRRIYDIVNVLESVEILKRRAKNQYQWFGKNNLAQSLINLKCIALSGNLDEQLSIILKSEANSSKTHLSNKDASENKDENWEIVFPVLYPTTKTSTPAPKESRKERSLGIMSQKFLMLYLLFPKKIISLDIAAKILNESTLRRGAQLKTKIRRLYDIANIFSSIGLIQKVFIVVSRGRKPAFKYAGPELSAVAKCFGRANSPRLEHNKTTAPSGNTVKEKSRSLVRHSSLHDICAVAEIERQKLSITDNANSCPPFNVKSETDTVIFTKTKVLYPKWKKPVPRNIFDALKTTTNEARRLACAPNPPRNQLNQKPTLKVIHFPSSKVAGESCVESKDSVPPVSKWAIVKTDVTKDSPVQNLSLHQNRTTNLQNTSQEMDTSKLPVVTVKPEMAEIILKALKMSRPPGQRFTIQFEESGSERPSREASPAAMKLGAILQAELQHKNSEKETENSDSKSSLFSDSDTSARESRSSNQSPTGRAALPMSPLSIPSGYVTPVICGNSNLSFPTNSQVNEVLQKLENSNAQAPISEISCDKFDVKHASPLGIASAHARYSVPQDKPVQWLLLTPDVQINNTLPQNFSGFSNVLDSCSTDSVNLEVNDILKSGVNSKQKPYLIDEKTILSPIKKNGTIFPGVHVITPPHFTPKNISHLTSKGILTPTDVKSPVLSFIPASGFCTMSLEDSQRLQEKGNVFIFPTP